MQFIKVQSSDTYNGLSKTHFINVNQIIQILISEYNDEHLGPSQNVVIFLSDGDSIPCCDNESYHEIKKLLMGM